MIMTKDDNKITRLMVLIIMQASKKFKNNRMLRIFTRTNGITKTFVKYMNKLRMSGYLICAQSYPKGYSGDKELQGSKLKGYSEQRRAVQGIL